MSLRLAAQGLGRASAEGSERPVVVVFYQKLPFTWQLGASGPSAEDMSCNLQHPILFHSHDESAISC
jgi:hypothetical protein